MMITKIAAYTPARTPNFRQNVHSSNHLWTSDDIDYLERKIKQLEIEQWMEGEYMPPNPHLIRCYEEKRYYQSILAEVKRKGFAERPIFYKD